MDIDRLTNAAQNKYDELRFVNTFFSWIIIRGFQDNLNKNYNCAVYQNPVINGFHLIK